MARTYSIYEAKTRLSELLRIVKSGSEVIVMERGKAIAKVVPFMQEGDFSTRLQSLEESGLLISGSRESMPDSPKRVAGGLQRFLDNR